MKEITYKVLIVSSKGNVLDSIKRLTGDDLIYPILTAQSLSEAKRILIDNDFDICIINSPLTDGIGIDFAIDLSQNKNTGIIMLTKPELYDEIYDKTYEYGVLSLSKPVTGPTYKQILKLMLASRERISRIEEVKSKKSLEERLNEIKIINNAKMLLIKYKKISEEEAHRYLEKRAMDFRRFKVDIARDVIEEYHKKEANHEN